MVESGVDSAVVSIGGIGATRFLTRRSLDPLIAETLARGEEWEPFESLVFRLLVRDGSLVCDVGANVGWFSVISSKLGASVIAFEPEPERFALLRANLDVNGCARVHAECVALSECVDAMVGERVVDVLRIDARGAEASILRGATSTLAGVGAMFVTLWPMGLRSFHSSSADLLDQLDGLDDVMFEIDSVARKLRPTTAAEMAERCSTGHYSEDGGGHLNLLLLSPARVREVEHLVAERSPGRPLAELLDPEARRRVELTVSCGDADAIPKVAHAGLVERFREEDVQIMHNGVRVVAGGYFGGWMSEIIHRLRGHHEPQEERVFHEIVERLASEPHGADGPVVVELGAFWSYYALWFLNSCPTGRAVLVEPDPSNLSIARRNLAVNDRTATVLHAAIGDTAKDVSFHCDSGDIVSVAMLSLTDVLDTAEIPRADLVLSDIQGAETRMLELACGEIGRRVRFLVVSTHHASISGRWDTHERCLSIIEQCGGHIIAEHSVSESFSGDGLIAASFDPRDRDMRVEVSHARAEHSLFRPPSDALVETQRLAASLEQSLAAAVAHAHSLEQQINPPEVPIEREPVDNKKTRAGMVAGRVRAAVTQRAIRLSERRRST